MIEPGEESKPPFAKTECADNRTFETRGRRAKIEESGTRMTERPRDDEDRIEAVRCPE